LQGLLRTGDPDDLKPVFRAVVSHLTEHRRAALDAPAPNSIFDGAGDRLQRAFEHLLSGRANWGALGTVINASQEKPVVFRAQTLAFEDSRHILAKLNETRDGDVAADALVTELVRAATHATP